MLYKFENYQYVVDFANKLEASALDTIESGAMTKDLYALSSLPSKTILTTEEFLQKIASRL